jgi:tRNA (cmo5U34)-methyltransferase
MAHSVEGHLNLRIQDYDAEIRRFVPAYDAMRRVQLDLLALVLGERVGKVLDLGGGTGALAAAVAARCPAVEVEIWDTDPAMLVAARERCRHFGNRVIFVERSFTDPLPTCDAVVSCIALHHVKDLAVKAGIYGNIHASLRPGGIFVNADAAVCSTPRAREFAFAGWEASMRAHGIEQEEARRHFAAWAHEDYYPPLFQELRLLESAGFPEPEAFWRDSAAVVFGAVKESNPDNNPSS